MHIEGGMASGSNVDIRGKTGRTEMLEIDLSLRLCDTGERATAQMCVVCLAAFPLREIDASALGNGRSISDPCEPDCITL